MLYRMKVSELQAATVVLHLDILGDGDCSRGHRGRQRHIDAGKGSANPRRIAGTVRDIASA